MKTEVLGVFEDNLVVEPVLIGQRGQVVQRQCVFLVDHTEGGRRFHNYHGLIFCNLCKDEMFPTGMAEYKIISHKNRHLNSTDTTMGA